MRLALLRLLKRPSAVSVLDSLITTPIGIEQLESRYKNLRCHSRKLQQGNNAQQVELEQPADNELSRCQHQPSTGRQFSFRVYEIQTSSKRNTRDNAHKWNALASTSTAEDPLWRLDLQPEKLEFESDIGHTNDIGTRLVDDPARRHDLALWEELLRYRQRHYGDRGTLDIWEGLTVRVDGVKLPVLGERADFFWQSFVDLGLKREVILKELIDYALDLWNDTGKRWDRLYDSVVGGFLERGMTRQAVEWHKRLRTPHLSSSNDILRVLGPAMTISNESERRPVATANAKRRSVSPGINAFKNICRYADGHQIYGPVISKLIQSGRVEDAFAMHLFLVERHDHPKAYEDIQPLFEYAKEYGSKKFLERLQVYINGLFPDQAGLMNENMSITQRQALEPHGGSWIEEKPFKDDFGARLFATKALNFEMILAGLRMFGVRAIGPQSLREMAIRAHGSQDILDKLRELQKADISIGDTVFARLIRKLAAENRDILLSDLIRSDQHPDVLEDARTQESLLTSYYIARDWRPYNMALAILGEISEEGPDLFNIHFRKYIASGEWTFATKVVDEMTLRGKTLAKESVDFMIEHALTSRRPGVKPVLGRKVSSGKEVAFIVRVFQRVAPMGASVSPELWVEILKRLGMTNSWDELRNCCLWLARHYSSNPKQTGAALTLSLPTNESAAPSRNYGDRVLEMIFSRQMQAAIVAWGFRMRVSSNPDSKHYNSLSLIPWVRGLVLLRELEQNGIRLWLRWIRQACRHRLAVLFGRPRQSSRHMNRMLRRENPYNIERVIGDINRAWGEPSLFQIRENNDLYRLANPPSSKMSQRRTRRTLWREARLRGAAFVGTK